MGGGEAVEGIQQKRCLQKAVCVSDEYWSNKVNCVVPDEVKSVILLILSYFNVVVR